MASFLDKYTLTQQAAAGTATNVLEWTGTAWQQIGGVTAVLS